MKAAKMLAEIRALVSELNRNFVSKKTVSKHKARRVSKSRRSKR